MLINLPHFHLATGLSLAVALTPAAGLAQRPAAQVVKNIVLVHGAFADGSSWAKIIPLLEARGFHVTAVQNPLTSLADDVAATKRIMALQDGPVILVGHSWGGAVITQAGDDPKVVGLVYIAAYAPDAGQSANDNSGPFGVTPGQKNIRVDAAHFATLLPEGVFEDFAQGLPMQDRRLVLAVQGQSYGPMFDERLTVAAWTTKPSWHVISAQDRMLPPSMEEADAKKTKGKATTLPTCHLAMLQLPEKVADVIADAANSALNK
jgi:pimeloyl-ACP methyl ester carboxylesterase